MEPSKLLSCRAFGECCGCCGFWRPSEGGGETPPPSLGAHHAFPRRIHPKKLATSFWCDVSRSPAVVKRSGVKRFTLFHSTMNRLTRCPATGFHLFQSVLAK